MEALFVIGAALAGAAVGAILDYFARDGWSGALRGGLIGFMVGANALVGGLLFNPAIGGVLGLITFLALIPPIGRSDVYQFILGWTSYVEPMSWPGHAIGFVVFLANVVGFPFSGLHGIRLDWKTGMIATLGGWVGKLAPGGLPAFSIGAFGFFDHDPAKSRTSIGDGLLDHEAGHHLNNAAFGWFQAYNVFGSGHDDKYFEKLAESNAPSSRGFARSDQWG